MRMGSGDSDLMVSDPIPAEVMKEASAQPAEAVLAMKVDDSENAFVILEVEEPGNGARTLAAVNDVENLSRVKLPSGRGDFAAGARRRADRRAAQ